MAQQTLEIVGSYKDKLQTRSVCETLCTVLINATEGYGFSVDRMQTTAQGRIRVTLSDPFPQAEIDSFAGTIIVV
jgi:hypothetical protein